MPQDFTPKIELQLIAVLLMLHGTAPIVAADGHQDKPTTGGDEEPVTLPEITVIGAPPDTIGYKATRATTATKTDTPIFDLPVSIQVVPRELMDDRQVILLQDALETVSGVVPFPGGGSAFDSPRIRGFEANTVYRDGFRGRFFGNYIQSTAHLERVEVLKGPASVLYGRMEPGGLINQVSKQPLAAPYYSLQQQFGSFDLYRTTLDATGPLTEDHSLLYRVNFEYLDSGSFRDFVGAETVFVAPVLTWNLSDRTHITLNLQYQHSDRVTDRGLAAQLNVENLLDKKYFKNVVSSSEIHPGVPRSFIGSLRIEF